MFRIVKIPKRNGKFRTIYIPDKEYKQDLRNLLTKDFFQKKFPDYVTAFVHDQNIVTNALKHVGFKFTLSFDLQDFFDSVDKEFFLKFSEKNQQLIEDCFINGRLRQGLPTSPYLANLAGLSLDEAIKRFIKKTFLKYKSKHVERNEIIDRVVYTRYADDLTFSFNKYETYLKLVNVIPKIISQSKFKINERKTHLQTSNFGFRRICGINVGPDRINIPKHIKKKLRACVHQKATTVANGLSEFMKLKPPCLEDKTRLQQARKLLQKYNLNVVAKKLRVRPKAIPEGQYGLVYITNDPVYFCGMSLYTTRWHSCMNIAGSYAVRKGVWVWNNLEGCSLAYIPSSEVVIRGGVTRTAMKNRALVFETEDGKRYYGRMYPNSFAMELQEAGFESATKAHGKRIKGYIKNRKGLPWQDNTRSIYIRNKTHIRFEL